MTSKKALRKYNGWNADKGERQAPAPDKPITGAKKKDTKRWCKGKVGREHTPEIINRRGRECRQMPKWAEGIRAYLNKPKWWCNHERVCTTCGKVLEWYIDPTDCPDYPEGWR